MITDNFKINDSETEFLIIGTKQQLNKVHIDKLSVGDSVTRPVTAARNLGDIFDGKMSLVQHMNNTCKMAFYSIHNNRRIRKYLSVEVAQTLVHAVVIGRLFCGLSAKSIGKSQRAQNAAAR